MKLAIISLGGRSSRSILKEAEAFFDTTTHIDIRKVDVHGTDKGMSIQYEGKPLEDFDCVYVRGSFRYVLLQRSITTALLGKSYLPLQPETFTLGHNKFLTLEALVGKGVRVPKTFLTGSKQSAKEIIDKEGLPIVLKLLAGFGGEGVLFMESKEAAHSAIETLKTLKQEILLEEYVENPGEDIRGIAAGEEIIASYKRIAAPDEKKANLHAGGRAAAFKLTPEMEEIVLKSTDAVKAKICAVDMIQGKDGIMVVEVNINPGLEGIEKTTGINVAQKIISYAKSQARR